MGKKNKRKGENPERVGTNCRVWQDLDPSLKSQSISRLRMVTFESPWLWFQKTQTCPAAFSLSSRPKPSPSVTLHHHHHPSNVLSGARPQSLSIFTFSPILSSLPTRLRGLTAHTFRSSPLSPCSDWTEDRD